MAALASRLLNIRPPTLLAADTTSLAVVGGLGIQLVRATFTPDPSLDDESLFTLADFTGASLLMAGATGGNVGVDPLTGDWLVHLKDPSGGWRFKVTGAGNLPQTIFGYIIEDTAGGVWGMEKFDTPRALTAVGMEIVIGDVAFRFPASYLNG